MKKKLSELSSKALGKNLLLGLGLGFILQSLVVAVMYLGGGYIIETTNNIGTLVPGFALGILSSFSEEILFRGILFRITEEWLGSITALIITALLFGAIHINNPNSSVLSTINVVITAGVLLGASYMYSRSLWMPIALHFAWNFAEGGIYGLPISGYNLEKGLLSSHRNGYNLITGGQFGPEASIQCLMFGGAVSFVLLWRTRSKSGFVKPLWIRKSQTTVN
jgi:uncharacterized protein